MAKKKGFKLTHHEPFVFYGDKGDYEIPPLEKLTYEQWKDVGAVATNADSKPGVILGAYKEFFLNVCPELKNEDIGDNQWFQFGSAYFEAMGEL